MNDTFLCHQCSAAARLLTPGKRLRCKHKGCTVVVRRNGERIYEFDRGKRPRSMSGPMESTMRR